MPMSTDSNCGEMGRCNVMFMKERKEGMREDDNREDGEREAR